MLLYSTVRQSLCCEIATHKHVPVTMVPECAAHVYRIDDFLWTVNTWTSSRPTTCTCSRSFSRAQSLALVFSRSYTCPKSSSHVKNNVKKMQICQINILNKRVHRESIESTEEGFYHLPILNLKEADVSREIQATIPPVVELGQNILG